MVGEIRKRVVVAERKKLVEEDSVLREGLEKVDMKVQVKRIALEKKDFFKIGLDLEGQLLMKIFFF